MLHMYTAARNDPKPEVSAMTTSPPLDPKGGMWNLIAVYLRLCREQRGQSGETVGRVINASKATVSRIETGKDRLDSTQARLLDTAWETGGIFEWLVFYASIGHAPQWLAEYVGAGAAGQPDQDLRTVRDHRPAPDRGLRTCAAGRRRLARQRSAPCRAHGAARCP